MVGDAEKLALKKISFHPSPDMTAPSFPICSRFCGAEEMGGASRTEARTRMRPVMGKGGERKH